MPEREYDACAWKTGRNSTGAWRSMNIPGKSECGNDVGVAEVISSRVQTGESRCMASLSSESRPCSASPPPGQIDSAGAHADTFPARPARQPDHTLYSPCLPDRSLSLFSSPASRSLLVSRAPSRSLIVRPARLAEPAEPNAPQVCATLPPDAVLQGRHPLGSWLHL